MQGLIERYDVLSVLVASLLPPPFPFKLFVVSAGVFRFPIARFAATVTVGRAFRFTLEAYLAASYGEHAKELLAKYYPAVGIAIAVLIIGLFIARQIYRRKDSALEA
ncbi:MAG: hypothetical protein WKF84_27280 [Pyrinomonadaceae bacterium]